MANKKKTKKSSNASKKSNIKSTKKVSSSKKKSSGSKNVTSSKKKVNKVAKNTNTVKNTGVKQNKTAKAVKTPLIANATKDIANNKKTNSSKLENLKFLIVKFLKNVLNFLSLSYSKCKNKVVEVFDKFLNKDKKKNVKKLTSKKNTKKIVPKKNTKRVNDSKNEVVLKNPFLKILYKLWNNTHILFNSVLIITYLILLMGLLRTDAFSAGAIVYISCILIFLMIVGMCYSRYLSGKVFSSFIVLAMSLAIYQLQYTYDFFNNLNTSKYEYKEYYVVTFDNGSNKSIYNINNKRVGLLKDNSTNVQRILNIKLDNVNYIEFDDPNRFYSAFFEYECRAIIVNANQYKYLTNYIEENSRNVKILYTFKANGLK